MCHKVIFHIDESGKWDLLLKNVANLLALADTQTSRIEVLANSEAVRELKNEPANPHLSSIERLFVQGVLFAACNNALNALGIRARELAPFVRVVPAGVLELVERQEQGYAYIKP